MAYTQKQLTFGEGSDNTPTDTWPATPASDDLLVTGISVDKNSGAITKPTGYILVHDYVATDVSGAMAYKYSDGTEGVTNWSIATSQPWVCWIGSYSGDVSEFDVAAEDDSGASAVTTMSSGVTASLNDTVSLAVAMWGGDSKGNFIGSTALTNSFTVEIDNQAGGGNPYLAVGELDVSGSGAQDSDFSTTGGGDQMFGIIAVFNDGGGVGGAGEFVYSNPQLNYRTSGRFARA